MHLDGFEWYKKRHPRCDLEPEPNPTFYDREAQIEFLKTIIATMQKNNPEDNLATTIYSFLDVFIESLFCHEEFACLPTEDLTAIKNGMIETINHKLKK